MVPRLWDSRQWTSTELKELCISISFEDRSSKQVSKKNVGTRVEVSRI